jgi:hypothetical protein
MRKVHLLLFAVGLAFLVFLIWRAGPHNLWQQFTLLGWGLIPIVIAEGIAELFHAISWQYCFRGPRRPIPLLRLFRIHLAGYAVNFLTPTASLAGEVTKAALLAGKRQTPEAVSAVVVGKLSFGLAHLLFVAAGSIVLLPVLQLPPALRGVLLVSGAALATGILAFLLLQKHGKLSVFVRWLVARKLFAKALRGLVLPMEEVDKTLRDFYREQPWNLAWSVLWHLLGYAVGFFVTWYFLFRLTDGSNWIVSARIWFLVLWCDLVTFAVPLNLGVLEGGRLMAFRSFGFGALPGMTFGMATRLTQLVWAGIGLINYALLIGRTPVRPPSPPLDEAFLTSNQEALEYSRSSNTEMQTVKTSSFEIECGCCASTVPWEAVSPAHESRGTSKQPS